jgi:hypothetical protein
MTEDVFNNTAGTTYAGAILIQWRNTDEHHLAHINHEIFWHFTAPLAGAVHISALVPVNRTIEVCARFPWTAGTPADSVLAPSSNQRRPSANSRRQLCLLRQRPWHFAAGVKDQPLVIVTTSTRVE